MSRLRSRRPVRHEQRSAGSSLSWTRSMAGLTRETRAVRRPSPVRSIVGPPARSTRQHRPAITTGSGDHRGPIQNPPGAREGLETDLTFVGDQHQERRTGVCTRVATNRCQGLLPDHRLVATVAIDVPAPHQGQLGCLRRLEDLVGERPARAARLVLPQHHTHPKAECCVPNHPDTPQLAEGFRVPPPARLDHVSQGPVGLHLPAQRARVLLSKQVHHVVVAPYPNDRAPAPGAPRVLDRELDQP